MAQSLTNDQIEIIIGQLFCNVIIGSDKHFMQILFCFFSDFFHRFHAPVFTLTIQIISKFSPPASDF